MNSKERRKEKYHTDPEYRARIKAKAKRRYDRTYHLYRDKKNRLARKLYAEDEQHRQKMLDRQAVSRNRDRIAERARKARGYYQLRSEVIQAYGGACYCCGESIAEFLTVEHTKNDGKAHRSRSGSCVYADLRRRGFPRDEGIEVACYNCNLGRRRRPECPHHKRALRLVAL